MHDLLRAGGKSHPPENIGPFRQDSKVLAFVWVFRYLVGVSIFHRSEDCCYILHFIIRDNLDPKPVGNISGPEHVFGRASLKSVQKHLPPLTLTCQSNGQNAVDTGGVS